MSLQLVKLSKEIGFAFDELEIESVDEKEEKSIL
jgi:hypothetical protein